MANTSYETGQRSDRNVTIEDIRAAEAYVDRLGKIEQAVSETLQALKDEQAQVQANMRAWDEYNEQLLQQFRERTAAAEAERIAKERTDEAVNRRRFTRQERVRAQQIADDAYARGDRPETAAKVLRADLQAARAELQASRARAEADERAAQAQERRLQAIRKSLTAQQRAYADRIANEELLAGARTSATPTESDYRAAERGVTALNDLADAEERAAKAMELRLEALRRNLTLEERAIADRKAREAILAGEVRSSLKPNQADYDAAVLENVETKKKADEEERAARATAARLESVKRIVSAEARRMAQMRADLEFTSQKRATNQVNEADLLAAEDQVQENARVAASEKEKTDLIEAETKAVEDAQKAWDGYFAKIKQKRIELDFRAQQKAIRDATNEAQRYAAKLASLKADRTQKALGALTSASQDLGFLFPQAQFVGNVTRLGVSFGKLGASIGRYAAASVKAGATTAGLVTFLSGGLLTGVGVAAGAFAGLASAALNAATSLARIAFSAAVRGLQLLLAPTLALVNAFQKVLSYAPALSVALGIGLSRSLTQAAVEMERLRALFDSAFLGDAGAQFEAIRERANRMGLTFTEAAQPMARLAFAARSAGLEVSAIDKLFEGVSSAAVALKLDSEKLNRAFTAFEQILSKGKVSSEELRGQLAEAIPGIVPIVQRALGKTGQELDKLLEKGEITAQELVRALGPELQSAFEVASLANADSLTAQLARIQNGFAQLKATLGASIAPAFIKFQQSLLDIANSGSVLGFLQSLVSRIAAVFDEIRSNVTIRSIGARLAEAFVALGPVIESISKKILLIVSIINGPIIIGLLRLAQELLPKIDSFLSSIIAKIQSITGLQWFPNNNAESFFDNVLGFIDNMLMKIELVPSALAAAFDSLKIRIFAYGGPILSFVGSLVARAGVLIVSGLSGAIRDAVTGAITGNSISGIGRQIDELKSELAYFESQKALPLEQREFSTRFGDPEGEILDKRISETKFKIEGLTKSREKAVSEEVKKYTESTASLASESAAAIKEEFGKIKLDEATAKAIDQVDAVTREKFGQFAGASIPGIRPVTVEKIRKEAIVIGSTIATGASKLAEAVSPLLTAGTAIGDSITKSLGPGGNALTSLLSSFATGGGLPLKTQLKAAGGAVSAFGGDILDGKSPFAALGTLLGRFAKLRQPLPDLTRQPDPQPVMETFKSQFLDAESIFQNMQAQETLKEQKRTNEELVALRNEVKRGNDFAMNAPRGLAVFSPNMRGALI
jgi:tape measure domain-containing protein